jgi:hypothetical protein
VPAAVFMFCAPGIVSHGAEAVESRFRVLRSQTHFRRYCGHRVPFSCYTLPNSFSAVPRAPAPVFMFYVPGLISHGTEGVGSRFHVLRSETRFRRYGGRRIPFSCFTRPDSFSAVTSASGPVFKFCAPGVVSCGITGVGSRFHVLRSLTRLLDHEFEALSRFINLGTQLHTTSNLKH